MLTKLNKNNLKEYKVFSTNYLDKIYKHIDFNLKSDLEISNVQIQFNASLQIMHNA